MRYNDGYVEQINVSVGRNQTSDVDFRYKIKPAPAPNAPAPVPAYEDEDTWKNKWVYLGFLGGYGSYSWEDTYTMYSYDPYYPSLSTSYQETTSYPMSFGIVGGMIQLQLLKYFALEVDLGVTFGEDTYPLVALAGTLTFRPSIFEIDVGAGYVIGFGPDVSLGLGIKLGGGVLFGEYMGIIGGEAVSDAFVSTFFAGYKFGLGSK
jgi:hypothetical protein